MTVSPDSAADAPPPTERSPVLADAMARAPRPGRRGVGRRTAGTVLLLLAACVVAVLAADRDERGPSGATATGVAALRAELPLPRALPPATAATPFAPPAASITPSPSIPPSLSVPPSPATVAERLTTATAARTPRPSVVPSRPQPGNAAPPHTIAPPTGPTTEGSPATVDAGNVQRTIFDRLTAAGHDVDWVSCPGDLPARIGSSQRCTLAAWTDASQARTEAYGVTVTVTGVQGATVAFAVKVDDRPQPA